MVVDSLEKGYCVEDSSGEELRILDPISSRFDKDPLSCSMLPLDNKVF